MDNFDLFVFKRHFLCGRPSSIQLFEKKDKRGKKKRKKKIRKKIKRKYEDVPRSLLLM